MSAKGVTVPCAGNINNRMTLYIDPYIDLLISADPLANGANRYNMSHSLFCGCKGEF